MFVTNEKTALFIDSSNLYSVSRALSFDIDYRALLVYFRSQTNIMRSYMYAALMPENTERHDAIRPLLDWLAYNGYTVVTRMHRENIDSLGRRRIKGDLHVEISCDMLGLADHIDHMVLFSGDSDLRRLVEEVQRKGVRVTIVSSIKTTPPMVADELRRQADHFTDVADIYQNFQRIRT